MFNKIVIANRGEIACRIIKTAKKMGIKTVAIYSTADERAQHVKLADEAYCVGSPKSSDSYLKQNKIIEIAKESGAEAIHPGYGFLAENPDFSDLCEQNDIVFIGPSAHAIQLMGDKSVAKKTVEKIKVPITPGFNSENQSENTLKKAADEIGYPILIKASAGGGGKGMRQVNHANEFLDALQSAKREAKSSFGNDHVFLEKLISPARHIEIQLLCDNHGNAIYLFDRDCSIQRRHQKIIEEAPAPNLPPEIKKAMGEAAVNAAKSISYSGAGTIEFLVDNDNRFYFMEMNTRLQVEHPVTEMITGVDLVEWQIRIAFNEALSLKQSDLIARGHAFEARLCAENPYDEYKPSIGKLHHFITPNENQQVRIDSGVIEGDSITPYYDSMIAKLITFANTRDEALALLKETLKNTVIIGLDNNASFLYQIAETPDFINANINTHFIQRHQNHFLSPESQINACTLQLVSVLEFQWQKNQTLLNSELSSDQNSPWFSADNWRLFESDRQAITIWINNEKKTLFVESKDQHYEIQFDFNHYQISCDVNDDYSFTANINKEMIHGHAIRFENAWHCFYSGMHFILEINRAVDSDSRSSQNHHTLTSPMPGTVIDVLVKPGQSVKAGDKLIIIEAMKMEHVILAETDGTIDEVFFKSGDTLSEGEQFCSFVKS